MIERTLVPEPIGVALRSLTGVSMKAVVVSETYDGIKRRRTDFRFKKCQTGTVGATVALAHESKVGSKSVAGDDRNIMRALGVRVCLLKNHSPVSDAVVLYKRMRTIFSATKYTVEPQTLEWLHQKRLLENLRMPLWRNPIEGSTHEKREKWCESSARA